MPLSFIEDKTLISWIKYYIEHGKCGIGKDFIARQAAQVLDIFNGDGTRLSSDYEQEFLVNAYYDETQTVFLMPQIYSAEVISDVTHNPISRRDIYGLVISKEPREDGVVLDKLQYFINKYLNALSEHIIAGNVQEVFWWIDVWNDVASNEDWNIILPAGRSILETALFNSRDGVFTQLKERYSPEYQPPPAYYLLKFLEDASANNYDNRTYREKFHEYMRNCLSENDQQWLGFMQNALIEEDTVLSETDPFYDFIGLNPLQYAVKLQDYQLAKTLLWIGARPYMPRRVSTISNTMTQIDGEFFSSYKSERYDDITKIEDSEKNEFMLAVDKSNLEMLKLLKKHILPRYLIFLIEYLYPYLISKNDFTLFKEADHIYEHLVDINRLLEICVTYGAYEIFGGLINSEMYQWDYIGKASDLFSDMLKNEHLVPDEVLIYMISIHEPDPDFYSNLENENPRVLIALQKSMSVSSFMKNIENITPKQYKRLYPKLYEKYDLLKRALKKENPSRLAELISSSQDNVSQVLKKVMSPNSTLTFSKRLRLSPH